MTSIRIAIIALLATGGVALAQSGPPAAVKARQGQMQIQAHALGILGGMARGDAEYDADMAAMATQDLAATGMLAIDLLWPEGTAVGEAEGTRALPAIWANPDDFRAKWAAFDAAVAGLENAADGGLDALRPAVGAMGASCGACHDAYRQTD